MKLPRNVVGFELCRHSRLQVTAHPCLLKPHTGFPISFNVLRLYITELYTATSTPDPSLESGEHLMHKLVRLCIAAAFICMFHANLSASVDLTVDACMGWPSVGNDDLAFGATGVGVSFRVSKNINRFSKLFIQSNILDFGLTDGFIPRDNDYSDSNIESVTDSYIVTCLPGLAFGTSYGGIIPYVNVMGGFAYHASLSRVSSRDFERITETFEKSGTKWQAGAALGMRTTLWERKDDSKLKLFRSINFDFRFEYLTGGKIESLDKRSMRFKNGELTYETIESEVKLTLLNFGFNLKF